ncbi:MAG: hypothetical protein ACM3TN_00915 [Alphaproteobacteria bacterium]
MIIINIGRHGYDYRPQRRYGSVRKNKNHDNHPNRERGKSSNKDLQPELTRRHLLFATGEHGSPVGLRREHVTAGPLIEQQDCHGEKQYHENACVIEKHLAAVGNRCGADFLHAEVACLRTV